MGGAFFVLPFFRKSCGYLGKNRPAALLTIKTRGIPKISMLYHMYRYKLWCSLSYAGADLGRLRRTPRVIRPVHIQDVMGTGNSFKVCLTGYGAISLDIY